MCRAQRWRWIKVWVTFVLLAVLSYAPETDTQDTLPTGVVVLVDMSQSFAPLTPEDKRALQVIGDALSRFTHQEWDQPVMMFWSTIGSFSPGATSPCGSAVLYRSRLVPRKQSREINSPEQLRAWLDACVERLTGGAVKIEPYTDIAGGVQHAAEVIRTVASRKVIFVISDFVESLPVRRPSVELRLSGQHLVMIYKPEIGDQKDANQMFRRLQEWEARFKRAGATSVCRLAIKGIVAPSVEACMR